MNHLEQPEVLNPFRGPLAAPLILEATHEELGEELERALLPLIVYCDTQERREDLSDWQANHVEEIRFALGSLMRYDGQVEELLSTYRSTLTTAQEALTEQVPTLEVALQPDWERTAHRMAHLATLPRKRYAPSSRLGRLEALLNTPAMIARAALPLEQRQAMASVTSNSPGSHE